MHAFLLLKVPPLVSWNKRLFGTGLRQKCLKAQRKFVLSTGRRNQHDKAWKMHAWGRLLIFNDVMRLPRPRSQQKRGKVNEFCW